MSARVKAILFTITPGVAEEALRAARHGRFRARAVVFAHDSRDVRIDGERATMTVRKEQNAIRDLRANARNLHERRLRVGVVKTMNAFECFVREHRACVREVRRAIACA